MYLGHKCSMKNINCTESARCQNHITYLIYQVYHNKEGWKTYMRIKKQIYHASVEPFWLSSVCCTCLNSCGTAKSSHFIPISGCFLFLLPFFTLCVCKILQYKIKRNEWKILQAIIQLFVIPNELLSSDFGHPKLIFWYIKLVNSKVSDISNFALTFKYALKIVLIAHFRDLH